MVFTETVVLAARPSFVSVDILPYIMVDGSTMTGTMT